MRITAITKFKHGGLWAALKELGWKQSRLARECGLPPSIIGSIINLQTRPTVKNANTIQRVLGSHGVYFDPTVEWPDVFRGMKTRITVEKTKDFTAVEIEAAQVYHQQVLLPVSEEEEEEKMLMEQSVSHGFSKLTNREQQVINMRYGLAGHAPSTLRKCAEELKCTQERVRQIEKKALGRLKCISKKKFEDLSKNRP